MNQIEQNEGSDSADGIREILYLFWAWAWLIVLVGMLAGFITSIVSMRTTPIYQSSTRLLVSDPPAMRSIDYTGIVNSQTVTRTYAEMLEERPVLQGVIDQLSLPTTPEELKETISVELIRDTQLLVVIVEHPSPVLAAEIANTIAKVFTDRIRELQSQRYAASRESLAQQVSDMGKQIEMTNQALANGIEPDQKVQLEARLTEYQRLYSNLVTNYEQVRLAEAQTSTNVVVSEPATIPTVPVSPKTVRNTLLAVAAGMLFAAGMVFTFDTLDDTIKNPDEIRRMFGLSILGMIARHESLDEKPISLVQPRSPVSESFRALRTNTIFAGVDKPLYRILVTSATPQEGKTTVSANLAVVLAQGERKVVVIDADLRRPQIHRKFGLYNRVGLSNLFLLMRPLDSLPQGVIQYSAAAKLAVVTSGKLPPNPAELLTSQKMSQFLDMLSQEYDIILIDTPPVLTVTDAAALAPCVDGVLLVTMPGKTRLRDFQQAFEQLQTVGARVLGVVLNEVDQRNRKYGYYYNRYYSKYSYYYGDSDRKKRPGDLIGKKVSAG
ncbi:MAG: polysaccharide biosynthesis tyrosine autokinase [Anaerolineales bacterium]|nr:polysaccharide biosynthesis tyrosine autokinase [Anaerolineales bacterium]